MKIIKKNCRHQSDKTQQNMKYFEISDNIFNFNEKKKK